MSNENKNAGVFQLENGYWGYRFVVKVNGKNRTQRRTLDDAGNPYKTETQAIRARKKALQKEQLSSFNTSDKEVIKKTVLEVYEKYCEKGRSGKAYTTIKKQDSLWRNHLKDRFGSRLVDELTLADIQDYLDELYYVDNRAFSYTESFLKMFYLILGQAYSRSYIKIFEIGNRLTI